MSIVIKFWFLINWEILEIGSILTVRLNLDDINISVMSPINVVTCLEKDIIEVDLEK